MYVHNTSVVRSVANNCGILFGQCESPIGRNVLYCMHRFNAALSDVLYAPKVMIVIAIKKGGCFFLDHSVNYLN